MLSALLSNLPSVAPVAEPQRYGPALPWPLTRRWRREDEEELVELKQEEKVLEREVPSLHKSVDAGFYARMDRSSERLAEIKERIEKLEEIKEEDELHIAFLSII